MSNISAATWSSSNNGKYHVAYTSDTSQNQFPEDNWYYTAAFGKFNTTPGTYYYGDNNGWKIETLFDITDGWNGLMGIGFMIDANYSESGLVKDYNSGGYTGTFIGSVGGYPSVFSFDNGWGVEKSSVYDENHLFASGTMMLEKGDDYEMSYTFKDSNGKVFFSGTWDPFDTWNSDEIVFGAYESDGYSSSSHTTCNARGTKIYYEGE